MSFRKLFIVVCLLLMTSAANSQSLKIMTYNIRLDTPSDSANAWIHRRAWLCEQVKTANPDLFGIQEGLPQQVSYIDSSCGGYRHIGVGREDGKFMGEFSAIWYDTLKFKLIRQGTFWLSANPTKPTMGWDAACKRVCTFGCFQEMATGRKFWMFNTHFDHIGLEARKNSAMLILQRMKIINPDGYPVILTGDFNATPDSGPIKLLSAELQDSKSADKSMAMDPGGTFNNFDTTKPAAERIDYIFTDQGFRSVSYNIIRESRNGHYASDHFPVIAVVKFSKD